MADAWMPGARRIRAKSDGGQMQGGAPRVVWLTLGTDPRTISVISAAQVLRDEGRPCHLVWDPLSGSIAQLLPIIRAGCTLGTREHICYQPEPDPGSGTGVAAAAAANREGRLCVQIAVLGSEREPFTSYPMTRLADILGWLDSWQIPRRWPAGQPAPYRQAEGRPRSRALWARGGHFGASQVPDCTSIGPGGIDIDQLTRPVSAASAAGAAAAGAAVPGAAVPGAVVAGAAAASVSSPATAEEPLMAPIPRSRRPLTAASV